MSKMYAYSRLKVKLEIFKKTKTLFSLHALTNVIKEDIVPVFLLQIYQCTYYATSPNFYVIKI